MGGSATNISVLGIDNIFQIHGVDSSGKRILKQRIEREKLWAYVANLPLSTIAMESCGKPCVIPGESDAISIYWKIILGVTGLK
jgi:hypothetical protein